MTQKTLFSALALSMLIGVPSQTWASNSAESQLAQQEASTTNSRRAFLLGEKNKLQEGRKIAREEATRLAVAASQYAAEASRVQERASLEEDPKAKALMDRRLRSENEAKSAFSGSAAGERRMAQEFQESIYLLDKQLEQLPPAL